MTRVAGIVAAVSVAVLAAAPWLDQRLVWSGWLAMAAALVLATGRHGWRHELLILLAAIVSLAQAFHWAPWALAEAMRADLKTGFLFAAPIVLWDACRLALPFFFLARTVRDPRVAWLPAALVAVVAEGMIPSVFPWKFGTSQMAWPITMQSADLLGPEGPTFFLFAHAGSLVVLYGLAAGLVPRRVPVIGIAAVVLSAANLGYGWWAMAATAERAALAPTFRVAVVQANPDDTSGIDDLRRLTRNACQPVAGRLPDLVCWPECSGGSYEEGLESFADEETVQRRSRPPLQGLRPLPDPPCPLLLGGKIYRGYPEKPREIFQAALLIDAAERLVGCSHKRHLMPFGEYVPGADLMPSLRLYFPMEDEFAAGTTGTVLECGAARLGTLLCYEDMVPEASSSLVNRSANVLVSLINGSSFTATLTLTQHRLLAQCRAIENRRSLVRCSATGETCVISPLGTVDARLPPGKPGFLIADVPLLEGQTVATRFGRWFPVASALALAVGWAWRRGRPA